MPETSFLDLAAAAGADPAVVTRPLVREDLEARWYAALARGEVDWSVYEGDEYLAEAWACWRDYSSRYLRLLARRPPFPLGDVRRVVDVGCGIGWSTGALAQVFEAAEVYGTQLEGSRQWDIAVRLAARLERPYTVVCDGTQGPRPVDLVFASEFFEHFPEPLGMAEEVVEGLGRPRYLVVASTFGQRSTGHFDSYEVRGARLDGRRTARAFNDQLRAWGYRAIRTGYWNNRPAVWSREL